MALAGRHSSPVNPVPKRGGLPWITDIFYENEKFTRTDSQLPIDPDPRATLIALSET